MELTFVGWEASPLETQAVKDEIAEFEKQHPNIKVNYVLGLAGSKNNAKLISSAAAGPVPDVMFVASESYRELAKKPIKDSIYGVCGLETVADTLNAQLLSNGGSRYNEDYTRSTMNSPQNKELFETIKNIRVKDGSAPDATTLDSVGMTAKQMLQTGKVIMLIDGSWSLHKLASSVMNVGMAPLLAYNKVLTSGQAHLHCISNTSKHKEEA